MKIAFVTSLFGSCPGTAFNNFSLIDNEGHDMIMFSNQPRPDWEKNTPWRCINVADHPEINRVGSHKQKSAFSKFMGWRLLQEMNLEYDFVFYCDGRFAPTKNQTSWSDIANKVLKLNRESLLADHHPVFHSYFQTTGKYPVIQQECRGIVCCKRDTVDNMIKTVEFLKQIAPQVNLNEFEAYYQTTAFGYHPEDHKFQSLTNKFWKLYSSTYPTVRDQPLWNTLILKHNINPVTPELIDENKQIIDRFISTMPGYGYNDHSDEFWDKQLKLVNNIKT